MFALVYIAEDRNVYAVNGSGRAGSDASVDKIKEKCNSEEEFMFSQFTVTVPGAAKGWEDLYLKVNTKLFIQE